MKVVCGACQTAFTVGDNLVQGKIVHFKCRKCTASIEVDGTLLDAAPAPPVTTRAIPPPPPSARKVVALSPGFMIGADDDEPIPISVEDAPPSDPPLRPLASAARERESYRAIMDLDGGFMGAAAGTELGSLLRAPDLSPPSLADLASQTPGGATASSAPASPSKAPAQAAQKTRTRVVLLGGVAATALGILVLRSQSAEKPTSPAPAAPAALTALDQPGVVGLVPQATIEPPAPHEPPPGPSSDLPAKTAEAPHADPPAAEAPHAETATARPHATEPSAAAPSTPEHSPTTSKAAAAPAPATAAEATGERAANAPLTAAATPNANAAPAAAPAAAAPAAAAPPAPSPDEGPEFDREAAVAALREAASTASGCKTDDSPVGVARVAITFAPSGRVTTANIEGAPFSGTKAGGCVAAKFRSVHIPAFSGSNVTVHKTVPFN